MKRTGNWKRPPTRIYEYNYDVGAHYYKPTINHLDRKSAGLSSELPGPMTFAERIAADPLYGKSKPVNYTASDIPARTHGAPAAEADSSKAKPDVVDTSVDDLLDRARNARLKSDNLLDTAGTKMNSAEFFEDAESSLAEMRKRREALKAELESENLIVKPRRNILEELNNVAKMEDSSLGNYASRRLLLSDVAAASSSSAVESSSSMKVSKRNIKTTVTTETVRY